MAQYKVPQDVEADDKLLGPFTFRQFIYLMVTGGAIALAIALFQIFPLLILIPAPVAIFFAILALPLKKDQPMETYLAAIVSYHLKPKKRLWNPGQRESTIMITAPKKVENPRKRDITGEEASTRLSFLANVIDTEGYAIRDNINTPLNAEFIANNADTPDMFDNYSSANLNSMINREQNARRAAIVEQMRTAINNADQALTAQPATVDSYAGVAASQLDTATAAAKPLGYVDPLKSSVVVRPNGLENQSIKSPETKAKMDALAHNKDFSVETIAKEANRIEKKAEKEKEVFVSLH
ncbi:PrgI family protein [Candidatus Saccharibacteria bacterium]|nr:PrgI family protein [Candidatus Saccharibacteria bacterium]